MRLKKWVIPTLIMIIIVIFTCLTSSFKVNTNEFNKNGSIQLFDKL